jgi:hypothetical protein
LFSAGFQGQQFGFFWAPLGVVPAQGFPLLTLLLFFFVFTPCTHVFASTGGEELDDSFISVMNDLGQAAELDDARSG